jgi:cytochrome c-type biogenesis protein CcmH
MTRLRRSAAAAIAALTALALLALAAAPAGASPAPRASLTDIEQDVMCPSCHEPLALAQSPQADFERAFISRMIAQGETKAQIERTLVAQYGPSVLGKPPANGFNLVVYILPPLALIAGAITLMVALPRWRRRTRAATAATAAAGAGPPHATHKLAPADARRLQEDLARFD